MSRREPQPMPDGMVRPDPPPAPPPKVDRCRRCGCTEDRACAGGCAWSDASHTLCTRCFAETAPGIKRRELTPCASCGEGLCRDRSITFCRISVERFLLDTSAVRRAHGEDLLMGPLAGVLGADEDLAKRFSETRALVCDECAIGQSPFELLERIDERAQEPGK